MKLFKAILIFVILGTNGLGAQNLQFNFGLPDSSYKVCGGELIIIEPLEDNLHGGITDVSTNKLRDVRNFLLKNSSSFYYKIYVNIDYWGQDKYNYALTERRAELIKFVFAEDTLFNNAVQYEVIPKGEENLLFKSCVIDSVKSKAYQYFLHWLNARVEIYIYKKI